MADGRRVRAKAPPAVIPHAERLLPPTLDNAVVDLEGKRVKLSNLRKVFWPALGLTKGDLLRYYLTIAPTLLPHLRDRAMVMRRYPDGAEGASFFMKRAPMSRPAWIETCAVTHRSGTSIEYPMIQDLASLLWVVNLGCIDLNQWYGRFDEPDHPDYMHFDLDPGGEASFAQVCETALALHAALEGLRIANYVKTTGSRGVHLYVPIVRGPTQKDVWRVAKAIALEIVARSGSLATAEYSTAKRPPTRVLIDYNQNASGQTLASVYSVRPSSRAAVSMPVTWREISRGIAIDDFRIDNAPQRIKRRGDLWAPLLARTGRVRLSRFQ